MCSCPESRWVSRANDLLSRQGEKRNALGHTVAFLLDEATGIDARVSIDRILEHLSVHGILLTREGFQQTVLGELKRLGIVATLVYPGPQGGVFIPCNDEDVRRVGLQVLERVYSEVSHLTEISRDTPIENRIANLAETISRTRDNL